MENTISEIKEGTIHFKWKGGKEVTLKCNVINGEEIEHDRITMIGMGELESVEVESECVIYPLCMECQTHLIKPRMVDVDGTNLEEVTECVNLDCPNKA